VGGPMEARKQNPSLGAAHAARFMTTRWSLVLAAGHGSGPHAHEALSILCESYWYPLYAFIRRQGYPADEAFDLTQSFFTRLLEKCDFATADPKRGRFRSWLLASATHFLSNARDHERAQKRGGGLILERIDAGEAEGRYGLEPSHEETPERLFERQWALALLARVLEALRHEWAKASKGPLFETLKGSLTGDKALATYQQIADEVGMTEGAVKVAVHRLRRRFRELLKAEVAQTLDRPEEMEEELRSLVAAMS
jgi:RNA polymerase sigma factor (sigma-70 family)